MAGIIWEWIWCMAVGLFKRGVHISVVRVFGIAGPHCMLCV